MSLLLSPRYLLLLLMLMGVSMVYAEDRALMDINILPLDPETHLIISLNRSFTYRSFFLAHPDRLVIDIHQAQPRLRFNKLLLVGTDIQDIRIGKRYHQDLRLVFDLRYPSHATYVVLQRQHQLVVHLYRKKGSVSTHLVSPQFLPAASAAIRNPGRDVRVVIDPGHGGKDPGAIGENGVYEKNIVLNIARKLEKLLNQTPGFCARLTRNKDVFIPLRERLHRARNQRADLFISIHADAYMQSNAHGASVYALSQKGESSEAARWLAEKENYSELMGGADLSGSSRLLRSVLINLQQHASIRASLHMGGSILQRLRNFTVLHHDTVEQASFIVLKSPDIPSLLIETGFLSNPSEARNLRNPDYQYRIVRALQQGIVHYFTHNPPKHSRLAYGSNGVSL